jgi:hypothetical protein
VRLRELVKDSPFFSLTITQLGMGVKVLRHYNREQSGGFLAPGQVIPHSFISRQPSKVEKNEKRRGYRPNPDK